MPGPFCRNRDVAFLIFADVGWRGLQCGRSWHVCSAGRATDRHSCNLRRAAWSMSCDLYGSKMSSVLRRKSSTNRCDDCPSGLPLACPSLFSQGLEGLESRHRQLEDVLFMCGRGILDRHRPQPRHKLELGGKCTRLHSFAGCRSTAGEALLSNSLPNPFAPDTS